jgi:hypothetical protein
MISMYNKKFRLVEIDAKKYNPMHEEILNKVCYPAYFNIGERGWFLCVVNEWPGGTHRVHTSPVDNILYADNQIIVVTENTKYVFELI